MNPARSASLLAVAACLAGCTVGPDYHEPDTTTPAAFEPASYTVGLHADMAQPEAKAGAKIDLTRWWQSFKDPELDSLVERAVKSNFDVLIALDRLQEARTQEVVVAGIALPSAEFSAGVGRGSGTDSARGRVAEPIYAGTNTAGLKQITHIIGFDAGWDLDLFGKYRRAIEAAGADSQAAAEARNAVLVAVVADVGRDYMDMRGLEMRLAVAFRNLDRAQHAVDLVQARFDRGLTNELDVSLARRELATLQAQIGPLQASITAARDSIAVLLGQYPGALAKELGKPGVIPPLPPRLEPGLPVDLLRRRPDIREAERELAAATARIGVATAALFPSVAITGGVGMQGQGLGISPVLSKFIWSAGPSAYWPLLDFGTLDALVDIQDLRTQALLLGYKQTIITAVEEVDEAIANYAAQQERLRDLSAALVASRRAVDLATQRYERGLTDFLNVLDAERQEDELQDEYAAAQQAAAEQYVALYKALGGGWEQYQAIPPSRTPEPAVLAAFHRIISPSAGLEPKAAATGK